ncbi:GNAT family N-acetyltransferase [Bacillus altitudinis]|uniref:GNAT family N-acetyltransferase n=1 Tax=Bacillus altitudinis TaxID=293387 RepID=UPI003315B697
MFTFNISDDLKLACLQVADAEALFALIQQNKDHLGEWLPWVNHCHCIEDVQSFIQSARAAYAEKKDIEAGIVLNDQLIGVFRMTFQHRIGNIGYWIGEAAQGQGIVTKTVKYMTDAFAPEVDGFEIFCPVGHVRSERVAMKAGFQLDPNYQPKPDAAFLLKRYIRKLNH